MSYPYLAILGRQPELSLVELESILSQNEIEPFLNHALLKTLPDIDRLGGTIKLARIIYDGAPIPVEDIPLDDSSLGLGDGKLSFGISYYGNQPSGRAILAAGLAIKKRLRGFGSVRFIAPGDRSVMTAAQLLHNKIPAKGFELIVLSNGQRTIAGLTESVQDIERYGERDHGRPARSATVGMLPPKLAQILVNTTHSQTIYDPFCGTGVILQESLLLDKTALGSDLSTEMVDAARTNLDWLSAKFPNLPNWSVSLQDARKIVLPKCAAVATEGYLGPNLSSAPSPTQVRQIKDELLPLYIQSLKHWATQLPSGGEVSLCAPSWRAKTGWIELGLVDELADLGYTLKQFAYAGNRPLRYARPDQTVGRSLLLLKRT